MTQTRPQSETALHGMKAICEHMGKSEKTIRLLVRRYGFPASKIGGEWVSDRQVINDWRILRLRQM